MVRAEPPDRPANLPATYQNPWGLLGRDLRAVVADLGLKLRALWRRNREGELSVPGLWPRPLQALFWPLLLALVLALPWIGWRLLPLGHEPVQATGPVPADPVGEDHTPNQGLEPLKSPSVPIAALSSGTSPLESPAAASPSGTLPTTAPAAPPEPTEPAELALDPLLQMLAEADPEHLILAAHPEPGLSLLRLTLAPAFGELPARMRSQWADRWCERALELGYERFELVDDQQRPLGRKALVGSGMILLNPLPKV